MKITILHSNLRLKTFWLNQLLRSIENHEISFITNKSDKNFNQNYNVIEIYSKAYLIVLKKLKDYFGLKLLDLYLLKVLNKIGSEVLLINFASLAIEYFELIRKFEGIVFIHVHGKDVTWDYYDPIKKNNIYGASYIRAIKDLPERVKFIANSEYSKTQLLKIGIKPHRVSLKYFGMKLHVEDEFSKTTSELKFLYVGRFVDVKRPLLLIEAFCEAKERGMLGTLTMVGDGELFSDCSKLVENSRWKDYIKLIGWGNHTIVMQLYKDCDIFVLPNGKGKLTNQVEAFGLVFLEAMSFGLPVIGGNSGGVPEIIQDNYNGFLVEDRLSLVNAMLKISSDSSLYKTLSKGSIDTIKNKFNLEQEKFQMDRILKKKAKD